MLKKLVIVESPNKIKAIQKYLGNDYVVMASVGHISKLKTSGFGGFGVDLETWKTDYAIDPKKKKVIAELKKQIKEIDEVYVATDPDREGEAIADNLINFLKIKSNYKRIRFNEITKDAILKSINNPTLIDSHLVDSQTTRRILDRIIGFSLSSLLKKKIWNTPTNPSAGRVQSIALKMVVEREKLIDAFIPVIYYKMALEILDNQKKLAVIEIFKKDKREHKDRLTNEEMENLKKLKWEKVELVKEKKLIKNEKSIIPLKQSAAYRKFYANFRFSASKSERILQTLYEKGLISYPRTDSTRIAKSFLSNAQKFITEKYGKEFLSKEMKGFSGAQDAHEAIRPTDIKLLPQDAKSKHSLEESHFSAYKFIFDTTLKSVMKPPKKEIITFEFNANEETFKCSTSKTIFPGYNIINNDISPIIEYDFTLNNFYSIINHKIDEHQTKPPARFNEGSLIKKMDDLGVGRPSTFAKTIKIIKDRTYVKSENNALKPTDFGKLVIEKLITSFNEIMQINYTASMENKLDDIANDTINFKIVLDNFWKLFQEELKNAKETMTLTKIPKPIVPKRYSEEQCPKCQIPLVYRNNRRTNEEFLGCDNFPKCRYIQKINN